MFQQSAGHIHAQAVLDFKLNLDLMARKDAFRKNLFYIAKEL